MSKSDAKVPRQTVVTVVESMMIVLKHRGVVGVIALHDLWKASSRPDYRMPARSARLLHQRHLVEEWRDLPMGWATARLSDDVRLIAQTAIRVEGWAGLVVVRPTSEVLREIGQ